MKDFLIRAINLSLSPLGFSLVPRQNLLLTYQHDYGAEGFESYRKFQIFHNKRKINEIWADEETLGVIAAYIKEHVPVVRSGICHGTRRGFEQAEFSRLLGCPVIGTEISDSARQFENTVQWDFHEPKEEWLKSFSFVYSNSIDQAFDPRKALSTWVAQLEDSGLLFLDHTMLHSAAGASEMDPFGAHPMVMPYLLFKWGSNDYRLVDILEIDHKQKHRVWIFVIRRGRMP
ncbi:MAG: hypothetical protein WD944_02680 [Steroidobacteraceae bacterium]